MTATDIAKIVATVAATQLATDLLANRYVFRAESYRRSVVSFDRARLRREKTAAAIAAKQQQQSSGGGGGKRGQSTSKSTERDAKKMQRETDEVSELAAEVARRHQMAGMWSSAAFFILYRIMSAEYTGRVVAVLPFQPFQLLRRISYRGLGSMAEATFVAAAASTPGARGLIPPPVSDASQACSFLFVYMLCTFSVKVLVNMLFGTKPPRGADEGMGTLMDSPKSRKMMETFGIDPDEMKEARATTGM